MSFHIISPASLAQLNETEISHGRVSWQIHWTHFEVGPLAHRLDRCFVPASIPITRSRGVLNAATNKAQPRTWLVITQWKPCCNSERLIALRLGNSVDSRNPFFQPEKKYGQNFCWLLVLGEAEHHIYYLEDAYAHRQGRFATTRRAIFCDDRYSVGEPRSAQTRVSAKRNIEEFRAHSRLR